MKKEITILHKKKKIKIIAEDCGFFRKIIGLMFSKRQNSQALLFKFEAKRKIMIHSFFVFYSFVAIWLDDGRIVDLKIVKPFIPCVSHKNKANKLIEIPINKKYNNILTLLVGDTKHLNIKKV